MTSVGRVMMPKILVRFRRDPGAPWSRPVTGLVDTGAWTTLISQPLAEILGFTKADLEKARLLRFTGVDGKESQGRQVTVDLLIGPMDPTFGVVLDFARVGVTPENLPYDILLGQHDALERLELNHRNQGSRPEYFMRQSPGRPAVPSAGSSKPSP